MKVKIIACMDPNRVIGKDGGIPWKCPDDMYFFKFMTWHRAVIMGRKTADSIPGGKLEGRSNFIITRRENAKADWEIGKDYFNSLEDAIKRAQLTEKLFPDQDDCWIIGGAAIYKEAINIADEIYLNILHDEYEGDTFFPSFESQYDLVSSKYKAKFTANHYTRKV